MPNTQCSISAVSASRQSECFIGSRDTLLAPNPYLVQSLYCTLSLDSTGAMPQVASDPWVDLGRSGSTRTPQNCEKQYQIRTGCSITIICFLTALEGSVNLLISPQQITAKLKAHKAHLNNPKEMPLLSHFPPDNYQTVNHKPTAKFHQIIQGKLVTHPGGHALQPVSCRANACNRTKCVAVSANTPPWCMKLTGQKACTEGEIAHSLHQ